MAKQNFRGSGGRGNSSSRGGSPQAGRGGSASGRGRPGGGRPNSSRPSGGGRPSFAADSRRDYIDVSPEGRMIMGDHAIREAFKVNPESLESIVLVDNWRDSEDLRELEELARSRRLKIDTRPVATLDRMGSHQGALVIAKDQPSVSVEELMAMESAVVLALDGVEDPHNLGAVLRSSWLMGVSAVLIPEDRAVGLTPVVHKVAAGGVEHVPVIRDNNFAAVFEQLKESGFWVFGMSHQAKGLVYDLAIPQKVVWVLGAEDKGLRTSTERFCDELVRLPQVSAEASYNVSVAAAMTLSETYRQLKMAKTSVKSEKS